MTDFFYWYWIVIGLLLIIIEAATPGFYTLWIGIAAVITGALKFFFPEMPFYVAGTIFTVLSVAICYMGKVWVYKKDLKETSGQINNRTKQYIGQKYKVIEAIENGRGKVQVGDTIWTVRSDKDVKKGSFVTIKDVDGTTLIA